MSAPNDIARLVSDLIASTMERSQASFDRDALAWAKENRRLNEARSALAAAVAALGERVTPTCPCPHAQRADELEEVLSRTRSALGCPVGVNITQYAEVMRRAAEESTPAALADAEARGRAAALAALPAQKPPPVINDDHERGYVNGWNAAVLAAASEIHASGLPYWGSRTDGKDGSP